jgi:hypothetical protein
LLLDLFGGALSPGVVYSIAALAEAYVLDPVSVAEAVDELRIDKYACLPLEGRVAFLPWTATSMAQRALDLRYLAAHSPVRIPPPAPLVDFRAAPGPFDIEVGLRFAGRVLDVPGHFPAARLFERSATVFAAYFLIRAGRDATIGDELRRSRKVLVHLLDAPFTHAADASPDEQQVIVKRALVDYLREHERLHEMVRSGTAEGALVGGGRPSVH